MAQTTAIEWTDVSWNPIHGCSKVSPGCAHCYAETLSLRYRQTPKPWTRANAAENVILKPHKLREPLSKAKPWDKPCRVFVNSMSDLFHELVPDEYIAKVFAIMAKAPQHTFQVLTKRPERMRELLTKPGWWFDVECAGGRYLEHTPLPNVWLGTSIENRRFVGRADDLRATPAAVRFISAEPLLGPLVKSRATTPDTPRVERPARGGVTCRNCGRPMDTWQWQCAYGDCTHDRWPDGYRGPELLLPGIDWLIVGGESGPRHRPIDRQWVSDLRDVAIDSDTAFFFKQWGGHTPKAGGRLLDGRTWDEFPAPVGVLQGTQEP